MHHIDVFTFLTRNSADYAELLYNSMEKLKSGNNNIHYKCVESIGCESLPVNWEIVDKIKVDQEHNCKNHAVAMHTALNYVESAVSIFIDADMCILYKDWDDIVLNELNKTPVWGTAFGDKSRQYHKFPNVFFFCFKKSLLKFVDFDFYPDITPGGESPVRKTIEYDYEAKVYNKKVGEQVKCDTGYRLPMIAYANNIKSGYMERVLGGDRNSQLPYRDDKQKAICFEKCEHMAEWHYKRKLFITHKQASRNHPLNGKWGKIWKDRIDLYTQKEYGWKI